MKLILLGVVRENRLTTQIEPVYLKLALCYVATKAGNVQCNKDFKTQWGGSFSEQPGTVEQKANGTSWKDNTMQVYAKVLCLASLNSTSKRKINHSTL